MMRNVVLGALIGFGAAVLLLATFGKEPPASASPSPPATAPLKRLSPEGARPVGMRELTRELPRLEVPRVEVDAGQKP
ncbi:MAG: hypothetical protein ACOZIN_08140 [Myxococcota bacterium]